MLGMTTGPNDDLKSVGMSRTSIKNSSLKLDPIAKTSLLGQDFNQSSSSFSSLKSTPNGERANS